MDNPQQLRTDSQSGLRNRKPTRANPKRHHQSQFDSQDHKQEIAHLDLFSTTQTKTCFHKSKPKRTDRKIFDACAYNAPYFGYQIEGKRWGVVQGCCNHWDCPRCGQQRAREEYGRIVAGSREIAKRYPLYFLTITCRGKEMSYETALDGYLEWTNRLLTRLRTKTKRIGGAWFYASVTEHQDRLHPHSHFITTYCPDDCVSIQKGQGKFFCTSGETFPAKHTTLQSESLERASVECGLGRQYDLSRVESIEAGSRYIAKYLFKTSVFEEVWPKGWRRVRYSQNWPKLPDVKTNALILLSNSDWNELARRALIVKTPDEGVAEIVRRKLSRHEVIIH